MIYLSGEEIHPAPDKSISHRALMISAIAEGKTTIKNFLRSDDCLSTLNCLKNLGVEIEDMGDTLIVNGKGKFLSPPSKPLYAGNSGTTARLLSGILAGQKFKSIITGDESLSKRPMNRIARPLTLMGAKIKTSADGKLPMEISGCGGELSPIDYDSPIASAQVKSCVLLAGLYTKNGATTFREPYLSRDHTERMLLNFGLKITRGITSKDPEGKYYTTIQSTQEKLTSPGEITVPGDISSAAFFLVAAAIIPNSSITIKNVGLNPTRTGILTVLTRMGANIKISPPKQTKNNEPTGDITIHSLQKTSLKATKLGKKEIPLLIDELPIIAVAATQAEGETIVSGAEELRVKETDRIKSIVTELSNLGAKIKELPDGFIITGPTKLTFNKNDKLNSYGDHRMAMSLAIALLAATGEPDNFANIKNFECASVSYPDFYQTLKNLIKK